MPIMVGVALVLVPLWALVFLAFGTLGGLSWTAIKKIPTDQILSIFHIRRHSTNMVF